MSNQVLKNSNMVNFMYFSYNNKNYEVIIEKKKIKNLYIRVKEDLKIYVSCNRFVSNKHIDKIIENNYKSICNMIEKQENRNNKNNDFYFLGNKYDVVYINTCSKVYIDDNKIFTKDDNMLLKWIKIKTYDIFNERLEKCKTAVCEKLPKINLKIRNMKTRWGVCNRANNNVTLNSNLIKYNEEIIDYVIFHELCHFTHPNHSSSFWNLVGFYVPNYKILRNELKK